MITLKQGAKAPDFALPDSKGKIHKLSDYKGKKVVLYFYPRDDTPGCTIQACSFRDRGRDFSKLKAAVIGISNDDEKTHKKFIEKYNLNFILLSDTKKEVVRKYGVYGKKKFMGREFDGIYRTTFIIDEKGVIARVFENVNPKTSSEESIGVLKEI